MSNTYDHQSIEPKWQHIWESQGAFVVDPATTNATRYVLDMFPYPSGSGLHVGHLLGYTGADILARFERLQGKTVLHPMGWDAFGLPAENFAIKNGIHPAISTKTNITEYRRQLRQAGLSYDWSKEINTSDPEYYKWTQWFFGLLYNRGLAYRKEGMVNWCSQCQTVLANEQVVNGACERCGTTVIQKMLKQWYFKITDYAERLLEDLEELDWPERIKTMQRNWIGKSVGSNLTFPVEGSEGITVFTTRPDTVFGATYLVLAPEHPLVNSITTADCIEAVEAYQQEVASKNELERTFLEKKKTGVFTGAYAVNPATQKSIPIWIADYVLGSYGTGAIMAVPAHDARDFEFATQFELPITRVVTGPDEVLPYLGDGTLTDSGSFTGKNNREVLPEMVAFLGSTIKTTYRLRDWLVSRQRFWGAPIPIAYTEDEQEYLIPAEELPVELPMDVAFLPTGQSPLTQAVDWKRYTRSDGAVLQREVDTLDTFVCSSWYYLRYLTPQLTTAAFDHDLVAKWLPVSTYIGGAEHAVLHLLYARFFTKVLFDAGMVPFKEPFTALKNQGSILGPDHNKMSKSKGNVVSPDEVIAEYGADALRVYEMFMAPFDLEKPWNTQGLVGIRRFLDKVWNLQELVTDTQPTEEELSALHKCIKKVEDDIQDCKFNTAVSTMMETVNTFQALPSVSTQTYRQFLQLLNPFAPHITEELWALHGGMGLCSLSIWPVYNAEHVTQSAIEYPVQINGKVRYKLHLPASTPDNEVLRAAKEHPRFNDYTAQGTVQRELVISGRMVAIVVQLNQSE